MATEHENPNRNHTTYDLNAFHQIPNQLRWDPFDLDHQGDHDWITGMHLLAGAGDPIMKTGLGILVYSISRDMATSSAFYSADGDLLVVPQLGSLDIRTELGSLLVRPNEICVIPRGVRYHVGIRGEGWQKCARGYALELYQGHFRLPDLGPIGSNGLANVADFQAPVAAYEMCVDREYSIVSK